jgi:hypothetical protein
LSSLACTVRLLFYASLHGWNDRHTQPHTLFSVMMGSHKLFCPVCSGTVIFPISASQVGVSHQHLAQLGFFFKLLSSKCFSYIFWVKCLIRYITCKPFFLFYGLPFTYW